MKKCPKCKKINSANAENCKNCGYEIIWVPDDGTNSKKPCNILAVESKSKDSVSNEEDSEVKIAMAAVAKRTTYLRNQAKKNHYTYCWNCNPMDELTKPICIKASLAGVIHEKEMERIHGFPPRNICRCEIVYTHKNWMEFNQSINEELRLVQIRLINDLNKKLRRLNMFNASGKIASPYDSVSVTNPEKYAELEEKHELVRNLKVPDFKG